MKSVASVERNPSEKGYLDYVLPRNPVNKNREFRLVPKSVERSLGSYLYPAMINSEGGYYSKHGYQPLLEKVGKRISQHSDRADLHFQFTVLDSRKLNAWCLPGGKVAFYRGIIEKMDLEKDTFGVGSFTLEEKIAAVMGHEITHACARHSARTLEFSAFCYLVASILQYALSVFITNIEKALKEGQENPAHPTTKKNKDMLVAAKTVDLLFNQFYDVIFSLLRSHGSRDHEFEADKYGMVYLKRSGYDPKAAIWLQKFFAKQHPNENGILDKIIHLFSTHPSSEERVKENLKTLELIKKGLLK